MQDLRRQGGAGYRIRTTDDARALTIARGQDGIEEVGRDELGVGFQADERHDGELTITLGAAGVGILALTPELATHEDLFFRLTGEAVPADGAPAAPAPPGDGQLVEAT